MSQVDSQKLAAFADACRRALEGLATNQGSMFHRFPLGACGPAAELVGRLLAERLGQSGSYVCGDGHPDLSPAQSHAWVESDKHIIDITHDQFSNTVVSGWVLPIESDWHRRFGNIERRSGFCMPSGWPMYPHDGYRAMLQALAE